MNYYLIKEAVYMARKVGRMELDDAFRFLRAKLEWGHDIEDAAVDLENHALAIAVERLSKPTHGPTP